MRTLSASLIILVALVVSPLTQAASSEMLNPGITLQLLTLNYVALCFIVVGIGFIIAEGFTASFGVLGVGGLLAFILGVTLLSNPEYVVNYIVWPVVWLIALVYLVLLVIFLGAALRSRRQKAENGMSILLGAKGKALGVINLEGQALIHGEIWSVRSKKNISANKPIKVISTSGIVLDVEEDIV